MNTSYHSLYQINFALRNSWIYCNKCIYLICKTYCDRSYRLFYFIIHSRGPQSMGRGLGAGRGLQASGQQKWLAGVCMCGRIFLPTCTGAHGPICTCMQARMGMLAWGECLQPVCACEKGPLGRVGCAARLHMCKQAASHCGECVAVRTHQCLLHAQTGPLVPHQCVWLRAHACMHTQILNLLFPLVCKPGKIGDL